MTKRNRKKQDKNTMKDTLTGKRIGNKEAICIDSAIDYVKKQGYMVIKPRYVEETIYSIVSISSILLFAVNIGVLK